MHLYFHTNIEMAPHYIKALSRDGDGHSVSGIYDYMMGNRKGHAMTGELMCATIISLALRRLVNADGSDYCHPRRGVYQMEDPRKTMKEMPSLYEQTIQIVSRARRELADSFCMNLNQGMDLKASTEAQETDREVLDKLKQIKVELAAMYQEFTNEMEYRRDQRSNMSAELQKGEDVYLPGTFEGEGYHVAVAASGSDYDRGGSSVLYVCGCLNRGSYPGIDYGRLYLFNRPF